MNTLKILLVIAPILSFLVLSLFFKSQTKNAATKTYLLHIFSVGYLATLCLIEIDEIFYGNTAMWTLLLCSLFILVLVSKDRHTGVSKFFSHGHHVGFSNAIATLFIVHSFIDGVLFGKSDFLQTGIVLHRFVDGIILFGLLYENRLSFIKIFIASAFVFSPIIGMLVSGGDGLLVFKNIFIFVLFSFLVLDVFSELNHSHGVSKNKILITIAIAVICALLLVH